MATLFEIKKAINLIRQYHSKIIILHCVSSYPTKIKDTNLSRIDYLKKKFPKYLIGVSDHTNTIHSCIAATVKGVVAIEKHYKLDNKTITTDSAFSIDSIQLKDLKSTTNDIFKSTKIAVTDNEKISKKLRRSIFAKENIKQNEKITKVNIETYRPKIGICASKYFKIIGKKTKKKFKRNDPIFEKDLY